MDIQAVSGGAVQEGPGGFTVTFPLRFRFTQDEVRFLLSVRASSPASNNGGLTLQREQCHMVPAIGGEPVSFPVVIAPREADKINVLYLQLQAKNVSDQNQIRIVLEFRNSIELPFLATFKWAQEEVQITDWEREGSPHRLLTSLSILVATLLLATAVKLFLLPKIVGLSSQF